jgi:hypothetical protein
MTLMFFMLAPVISCISLTVKYLPSLMSIIKLSAFFRQCTKL